jgi:16S rRNA (uracil1498-N3)-methyltransferase
MNTAALRSTSAHVFVAPEVLDGDHPIDLDADTHHHLARVLRLRDGEVVSVTDGEGRWRLTVVTAAATHLCLEPTTPLATEARTAEPLTIATAMPKGDRLDWLVQKVTELGADRVVLLHADRSVVRWKPERAGTQRDRLQRIADEACRQSRRVWRPVVEGPVEAMSILASCVVAEPGGRRLGAGDRTVAVGPEGGWSQRELELAAGRVDLGGLILRTETAAVAVATLCVAFER